MQQLNIVGWLTCTVDTRVSHQHSCLADTEHRMCDNMPADRAHDRSKIFSHHQKVLWVTCDLCSPDDRGSRGEDSTHSGQSYSDHDQSCLELLSCDECWDDRPGSHGCTLLQTWSTVPRQCAHTFLWPHQPFIGQPVLMMREEEAVILHFS